MKQLDDAITYTETEMWRILRKLVGVKLGPDNQPVYDPEARGYGNIYEQFADITRVESLAQRAKKLRESRNILAKLDLELKGELP